MMREENRFSDLGGGAGFIGDRVGVELLVYESQIELNKYKFLWVGQAVSFAPEGDILRLTN